MATLVITMPSTYWMYVEKYGSEEAALLFWLRDELPQEEMDDWTERGYASAHLGPLIKAMFKEFVRLAPEEVRDV